MAHEVNDAVARGADRAVIEQLIASMGGLARPGGEIEMRSAPRVVIAPDRAAAVASYYVRRHDLESLDVMELAYGRTWLRRGEAGWSFHHHSRRATGSEDGPGFLNAGLRPRLHSALAPSKDVDAATAYALDVNAVRDLVVTYGIAADGGSADLVAALYSEDTVLEIEGVARLNGREHVASMFAAPSHQGLMPWSCHTTGPCLVQIVGDRAISTNYHRTYGRAGDHQGMWRFGINRWDFRKDGDGIWRITRRISRLIQGDGFRELLGQALNEASVPPGTALDCAAGQLVDLTEIEQHVVALGFALDARDMAALSSRFAAGAEITSGGGRIGAPSQLAAAIEGLAGSGAAHACEPPVIQIHGDRASAAHLLSIYVEDGTRGHRLGGLLRCEWTLQRRPNGWIGSSLSIEEI